MSQVFHIAPATVSRAWVILPLVIVLAVLLGTTFLMTRMVRGSRTSTFEVSDAGLTLHGDVYGRRIPMTEIVRSGVARVDVSTGPYAPTTRTAGTAVPGYRAGWFRLRNGHKALLYVTDPNRVVLVPTTAGYDVLLSVDDPDGFVTALGAPAAARAP